MRIFLLVAALVLLAGCDRGMTPDEIRAAIDDCAEYGLTPKWYSGGLPMKVVDYQCVQPK